MERAIGVLKKRWGCLYGLRLQPQKASQVIAACVCLHNFCIGDPFPEDEILDSEDLDDMEAPDFHVTNAAIARRDAIAATFMQ